MAENINLLPQQSEENKQQSRQRKLINRISAIGLILAIAVVIGLFAAKLVLGQQLSGIEDEIKSHEARIQSKQAEEYIQRSLTSRLSKLDSFFSTQNHFSKALTALSKTFPASLKLTDMTVTAEKVVTLTGTVSSYADLAGFYAKLRLSGAPSGSEVGTDFTTPMLTSISRNAESNQIEFSLTFGMSPALMQVAAAGDAK